MEIPKYLTYSFKFS